MRLPESAQSRSDRWRPPSASSHRQEPHEKGAWKSLTCLKRNTISQLWDIIPPLLWLPKFHRNFLHRAGRFIWSSQNTRYKVGGKKFICLWKGTPLHRSMAAAESSCQQMCAPGRNACARWSHFSSGSVTKSCRGCSSLETLQGGSCACEHRHLSRSTTWGAA